MFATAPRQFTPTRRSRGVIRTLAVISFSTVAATAIAGTAHAAPATSAPVKYTVTPAANSMSIKVDQGTIDTDNGKLSIRNNAGTVVYQVPLAYRMEYREFPIDARTVGNTATLTPSKDISRSTPVAKSQVDALRADAAKQQAKPKVDPDAPKTRKQRDDQALNKFNQTLGTGMTISQLVGLIIGAVVGGVAGCVVGGVLGLGIGCFLGGLPAGASIGGIIGLALGGGGTLIYAAIQYFQTINSPFKAPA